MLFFKRFNLPYPFAAFKPRRGILGCHCLTETVVNQAPDRGLLWIVHKFGVRLDLRAREKMGQKTWYMTFAAKVTIWGLVRFPFDEMSDQKKSHQSDELECILIGKFATCSEYVL